MSDYRDELRYAREKFEEAERVYILNTEPCKNKSCSSFAEGKAVLNCRWTIEVDSCREYTSEEAGE